MSTCVDDTMFLLRDLQENGPQSSWDWPADRRFAAHIGDTDAVELFQWAIDSHMVLPVLIAIVRTGGERVKQRRLRALRKLVHLGKVGSGWDGMGENGVYYFGVNRTRIYYLAGKEPRQIR